MYLVIKYLIENKSGISSRLSLLFIHQINPNGNEPFASKLNLKKMSVGFQPYDICGFLGTILELIMKSHE